MKDKNLRKSYIVEKYPRQWKVEKKRHDNQNYNSELIQKIKGKKNGKILEVGIGDGEPFSEELEKYGFDVYGVDLSPIHIKTVKQKYPNINATVGDAENLDFGNNFFDVVFCYRSSWYFPDLIKAISEMLRVAKVDGLVVFDIQNAQNSIHQLSLKEKKRVQKENIFKYVFFKYFKNIIKVLIKPFKSSYHIDWSFNKPIVIGMPVNPDKIISFLKTKKEITFHIFGVSWDRSPSLIKLKDLTNINEFDRLVFEIFINN